MNDNKEETPEPRKIKELINNLITSKVICNCRYKCRKICMDRHYELHDREKSCNGSTCKADEFNTYYAECLPKT